MGGLTRVLAAEVPELGGVRVPAISRDGKKDVVLLLRIELRTS
jgi:hypothetical protein